MCHGGMMGQGGCPTDRMARYGPMELKSMCDLHEKMRNAKTPEERSAMLDQHMRHMAPEMRQRHLEMMEQHCSSAR